MQPLNLPAYACKTKKKESGQAIFDSFRKTWVALTPEEWVRQHFLHWLVNDLGYPAGLIAVEASLQYNTLKKRADAIVYNKNGQAVVLIECKAPGVKITQKTFEQAAAYNFAFQTQYLILTNGIEHFCCKIDAANKQWRFLENIPVFSEL